MRSEERTGRWSWPSRLSLPANARSWLDPTVLQRRSLFLLARSLTYLVLVDVSFVFLFPVLYMLTTSLKSPEDLADITITWVPRGIYWLNYALAYQILNYLPALENSLEISVPAAIGQVIMCSFIAYGFARIRFPGREVLFFLVIFTFLIPPQTIIVPLFILYKNLGWINSIYPFVVPPFLGHGLDGALFILVFRQFFRGLPWELEDAASIDGASPFRIYWQIMLPLATPAILVVFLFSFVWHWNDYFQPTMFFMTQEHFTLPMRLSVLWTVLDQMTLGQAHDYFNEALSMAATLLVVLPPLVIYLFTQRFFVESIDRTGLVE